MGITIKTDYKMLYVVYLKGKSDATCIRTASYVNGFIQNGVDTKLFFLLPNDASWETPKYLSERVYECSEYCPSIIRKSKLLAFAWACFHVVNKMSKQDVLFCPRPNWLIMKLARLKRIRVYTEITEVPYNQTQPSYKNQLIDYLAQRAAKKSNGCFVISQGLETYYSNMRIPVLGVINMFVDIERFNNLDVIENNTISYCGSISNYKDGVDILIKSFAIVAKTNPTIKLQIIGGFVSEETRLQINKLVKDLGLGQRIIFTGRINAMEMPKILSCSKILVLARPNNIQAQYGFPTKLGEYLCTARPVVVTDVGELHLYLQDKISCIFAIPDDIDSFASCINWVIEHPDEATSIGQKGREVALEAFSAYTESHKAALLMGLL